MNAKETLSLCHCTVPVSMLTAVMPLCQGMSRTAKPCRKIVFPHSPSTPTHQSSPNDFPFHRALPERLSMQKKLTFRLLVSRCSPTITPTSVGYNLQIGDSVRNCQVSFRSLFVRGKKPIG